MKAKKQNPADFRAYLSSLIVMGKLSTKKNEEALTFERIPAYSLQWAG